MVVVRRGDRYGFLFGPWPGPWPLPFLGPWPLPCLGGGGGDGLVWVVVVGDGVVLRGAEGVVLPAV